MARVNVEQKALTDSRFGRLGLELISREIGEAATGVSMETAQSLGVGRMVRVWNACQERETYTLSHLDLFVLLGCEHSDEILISCGLGQRVKGGGIRICGTGDRIEWLAKARANGTKGAPYGVRGGRPPKTPDGVLNKPPVGFPQKPPPAPTLNTKESTQEGATDTAPIEKAFTAVWGVYPRTSRGDEILAQQMFVECVTADDVDAVVAAAKNYAAKIDVTYAAKLPKWLREWRNWVPAPPKPAEANFRWI